MASTNIQRQHTTAPTDNKKCTISVWVKRSELSGSAYYGIYGGINAAWNAAGNVQIGFGNDKAYCWFKTASGDRKKQDSTRLFRDTNAWYHFVYRIDTTQSTASDRIRVYCNNEEVTSWGSTTDPTLNEDISFTTNGYTNYIGKFNFTNGSVNYFNGVLSHFHLCDGYSYAPTEFGSTDANGVWKINTSPNVQYGNNGYFILKDGNSLTDQSGQSNNWSSHNGTLTKTEDNPSNVFCIFNKLYNTNANNDLVPAITLGNTMLSGHGSGWFQIPGTLAFNKGKFYWECKFNAGTNLDKNTPGVIDYEKCFGTGQFQDQTGSVFYKNEDGGETRLDGNTSSADYGTLAQNDILGIAVDMDAATPTVKYYKNGSLLVTVNASSLLGKFITPANTVYASGEYQVNFGNGYFGTTAVSSAGTNASGNGIFEFDVPTNYTALSTKGLNL